MQRGTQTAARLVSQLTEDGEEKRLHDKCKNALNLKSEDCTSVNKRKRQKP